MAISQESLKSKVDELLANIKSMSESYNLNKFNIEIILEDPMKKHTVEFKLDKSSNLKGSNDVQSTLTSNAFIDSDALPSVQPNQEGGFNGFSATSLLTSELPHSNLKGGSRKNMLSTTSELTTDIYNLRNKSIISETSDFNINRKTKLTGGNIFSETSDVSIAKNMKFSETSMSATSDISVAKNIKFSETSDVNTGKTKFVGGNFSETSDVSVIKNKKFSETSMSETSDISIGRNNLKGGGFLSTTSSDVKPFIKHKSSKIDSTSSKMELIKQKIRELETSDLNIFKSTGLQSGGAIKNNLNEIKLAVGINSSSTSSLCE